jgi:gas vesicle protein
MKSGKVLLGVLAGVSVGTLLGILFAPDKGWNTRKRISKNGEDYTETLKEIFKELIDSISEKYKKVKEEVSDFTEQSTSKSGETEKEVKTATD